MVWSSGDFGCSILRLATAFSARSRERGSHVLVTYEGEGDAKQRGERRGVPPQF